MPEIIIAANDGSQLKVVEHGGVLLPKQYTSEEWEELVQAIATAAKVGAALTVGQIIMMFTSGQALKAMWPLINAF